MSSPKFYQDCPLDAAQVNQCLNSQTILINREFQDIKDEIVNIKSDIQKLSKNIEKLVEILNQSNPRAKNIMIRSYSTSGVVSSFISEPKENLK